MATDVWMALRSIVAARDGMRCIYCKVPTAATLEHVDARSRHGGHHAENLRLACPSCNSRKRDEEINTWMAREGWRLPAPPPLPATVSEMVRTLYIPTFKAPGYANSGSTNSRLRIDDQRVCLLEVRPGRPYPWEIIRLGLEDHPRVVLGSYDFLRRHNTAKAGGKRRQRTTR
ncbi:HNH endonuclease [Miltoncostaea oceani]|uniref:HNH endonuclease n=1 Tax=Miltoncostaea oceani TaxID=2843216 RepID=UPI001C3C6704|nr:HNH endonuclease signature motif containing protein [Miltoncostaea oceani]